MPRKSASSKTRKSVAKRFKITASGKILGNSPGRRHLAAVKNRKRLRKLAKTKVISESNDGRIKNSLPFSNRK